MQISLLKVFCRSGDATSEDNASTKLGKDKQCKYTREYQLRGRRWCWKGAIRAGGNTDCF